MAAKLENFSGEMSDKSRTSTETESDEEEPGKNSKDLHDN